MKTIFGSDKHIILVISLPILILNISSQLISIYFHITIRPDKSPDIIWFSDILAITLTEFEWEAKVHIFLNSLVLFSSYTYMTPSESPEKILLLSFKYKQQPHLPLIVWTSL